MEKEIRDALKEFDHFYDDVTCLECGYEGKTGIIESKPIFSFHKYFYSLLSLSAASFVIGLFTDTDAFIMISMTTFMPILIGGIILMNVLPERIIRGRRYLVQCPSCKSELELSDE